MGGPQKIKISEMIVYLKEIGLGVEDGMVLVLVLDDEWMLYYQKHNAPKKGK